MRTSSLQHSGSVLRTADILADDDRRALRSSWGEWRVVSRGKVLAHDDGYSIDLTTCTDSASILDWIAQILHKGLDVEGLVAALDDVLDLQERFCGLGIDHRVNPGPILRERHERTSHCATRGLCARMIGGRRRR